MSFTGSEGEAVLSWTEAVARIGRMLAEHRPSLYPTEEWDDLIDIRISKLSLDVADSSKGDDGQAVKSVLHLWNESLDLSHELSQDMHTPLGSCLHGIMHRMEGDYSNAKYWFRQAGSLPVHSSLLELAKALSPVGDWERIGSVTLRSQLERLVSASAWDSLLFVDAIAHQVTVAHDAAAEELLLELQWTELKLLLQYAIQQSGGESLEL